MNHQTKSETTELILLLEEIPHFLCIVNHVYVVIRDQEINPIQHHSTSNYID